MSRSFTGVIQEYDAAQEEMVPAQRRFREHFFIDRDYYVQAICDDEETVLAFSVTTRSNRFRPTFKFPPKPSWRIRRRLKKQGDTSSVTRSKSS